MNDPAASPMTPLDAHVREQIDTLLIDYCHQLDDEQWDTWPQFFTEDGTYKILTRENHEAGLPLGVMYCDGIGMMKDRMLALQTANIFEPHTHCHILGRSALKLDGGIVTARTNFTVTRTMQTGAMENFATGKYLDRIVPTANGPRFKERIAVIESRRIDILLVAPI